MNVATKERTLVGETRKRASIGRGRGRERETESGFRDDVCRIIANGCISDPHSVRHVSPRARCSYLAGCFTARRRNSRAALPLLVIIYSYISYRTGLCPFHLLLPASPFSPMADKETGVRDQERERERARARERAVAHAFVNVCRCRHPPTYANHLI